MKVSFDGIGGKLVTFLNNQAKKGEVVKVSAAGTVSPCGSGDGFDGVGLSRSFGSGPASGNRNAL